MFANRLTRTQIVLERKAKKVARSRIAGLRGEWFYSG